MVFSIAFDHECRQPVKDPVILSLIEIKDIFLSITTETVDISKYHLSYHNSEIKIILDSPLNLII